MKCPACGNSCSDLRDICPACTHDLRQHKKELGLENDANWNLLDKLFKRNPAPPAILADMPVPPPPSAPTSQTVAVFETKEKQLNPLQTLFEQVRMDVERSSDAIGVEIGVAQFVHPKNTEYTRLLFELARDAILDPESEKRFIAEVNLSELRTVKADSLQEQLSKVEAFFDLPGATLKGLKDRALKRSPESQAAPAPSPYLPPIDFPPLSRRLKSFLLDMCVIVLVAIVFSVCRLYFFYETSIHPRLEQFSVGAKAFDIFDIVQALQLFGYAFLFLLLMYPLIALTYFKKTWGMKRARIMIVRSPAPKHRGYGIGKAQAFIRALSFPLALFLGGCFPLLKGKPGLHERLSQTQLALLNKRILE